MREVAISRETIQWRLSADKPLWTNAAVTLSPPDQKAVIISFRALYGGARAVLQLDDITLEDGACSYLGLSCFLASPTFLG